MPKCTLHITLLILFATLISCNDVSAQANIWLGGGINKAKMRKVYANEAFSDEDNLQTGFNVSFSLQQDLSKKLDVVSSIVYDTKGYMTKMDDEVNTIIHFKTHYLDIYPTSILYYHALNETSSLYGVTGPYLGIGLFGNESTQDDNGSIEEEIDWGKLELERFDFGWNFALGYEYNKIAQCELSYDMGIKNITENTNKYLELRNHAVKLSVKLSLSHILFPLFNKEEK